MNWKAIVLEENQVTKKRNLVKILLETEVAFYVTFLVCFATTFYDLAILLV